MFFGTGEMGRGGIRSPSGELPQPSDPSSPSSLPSLFFLLVLLFFLAISGWRFTSFIVGAVAPRTTHVPLHMTRVILGFSTYANTQQHRISDFCQWPFSPTGAYTQRVSTLVGGTNMFCFCRFLVVCCLERSSPFKHITCLQYQGSRR